MISFLSQGVSFQKRGINTAYGKRLFDFISDNEKIAASIYHKSGMASKGNHVIATFINSVLTSIYLDVERYAYNVQDESLINARRLGIGTAICPPELNPKGDFYGIPEVLIGITDVPEKFKSWWLYEPLKVIWHPRTDITYTLLDGKPNTSENGLAVISINFVELMLMYRGFQLWQNKINKDTPQGPVHFIQSWLLPSMMRSHNAIALLNQLKAEAMGFPFATEEKRTFFRIPQNNYLFVAYRQWMLDKLATNKMDWVEISQMTQMTQEDDLLSFFKSPPVPPTKYGKIIDLLYGLSPLSYLEIASTLGPASLADMNKKWLGELDRYFRRYYSEHWMAQSKLGHAVDKIITDDIITLLP